MRAIQDQLAETAAQLRRVEEMTAAIHAELGRF
jgi:hypothetical protein